MLGVGNDSNNSGGGDGDGLGDVDRPNLPMGANAYAFETSDTSWNTDVALAMEGRRSGDGSIFVEHGPRGDHARIEVTFAGDGNARVMGLTFSLVETHLGARVFAPTTYELVPGGDAQGVHVEGPYPIIDEHESDYCPGSLNGELKIDEITFGAYGSVSTFKGALEGECPDFGSHVRAAWSYESGDPLKLRGDEDDCEVPGETGYCWTVEIGAYAGRGTPWQLGGDDAMGFANLKNEGTGLEVTFTQMGLPTGVTFFLGNVKGGAPLMANRRYSSDDLRGDRSIELTAEGWMDCAQLSGWFEIEEMEEIPNNTLLAKLAADLELVCDDRVFAAKIRVDSTMP
jgi:hypothetical protein